MERLERIFQNEYAAAWKNIDELSCKRLLLEILKMAFKDMAWPCRVSGPEKISYERFAFLYEQTKKVGGIPSRKRIDWKISQSHISAWHWFWSDSGEWASGIRKICHYLSVDLEVVRECKRAHKICIYFSQREHEEGKENLTARTHGVRNVLL